MFAFGFYLCAVWQADSSAIQPLGLAEGEQVLAGIELGMEGLAELSADDDYTPWAGLDDDSQANDDDDGQPGLGIAVAEAEDPSALVPPQSTLVEPSNVGADAGDGVAKRGWQHHDLSHRWKTFHFTYSPPSVKPPAGQWYCRCGYHKLNSMTSCSKSVSIKVGEDPVSVKKALMLWALEAPKHLRRRDHGAVQPRRLLQEAGGDSISLDLLEARAERLPAPAAEVKTDGDLLVSRSRAKMEKD